MITNEQWHLVYPIIVRFAPKRPIGRPRADDRQVLEAILWKLTTDLSWRDLPARYPPWQTCYHRYRQWDEAGVLLRVLIAIRDDLDHVATVNPTISSQRWVTRTAELLGSSQVGAILRAAQLSQATA
jgi:transposase